MARLGDRHRGARHGGAPCVDDGDDQVAGAVSADALRGPGEGVAPVRRREGEAENGREHGAPPQ